jgi:4-amino-4-deoxy-L-arabinose transferase-like glycosyltransferase
VTDKATPVPAAQGDDRAKIWGLAAAAVAFGSFLRVFRLDWQSLWLDEIHTLGPALHATSLYDAFWNYINLSPTPPLYYLFMITWTDFFGFSEIALRLPSAIAGIATIGVFWWGLARVFDRPTSAVATILMALSWPALFYSQEVRGYEAVLLFSTVAAVLAADILKNFDGSSRRTWLFLLAASVLAAMTHPFGFIINGFLLLYLFLVAIRRRTWVLRSFVIGALLLASYLPWLVVNLTGIQWVLQGTVFTRPDIWFIVDIGAFLFHHPVPALLTAIVPLGIGAFAFSGHLREAISSRALDDPAIYLPFMLAAPFAFVFAVAQFEPFIYTRYFIVFLPYIYMFFAFVLMSRQWQRKVVPVGLTFLLAMSAEYWILRDYYLIEKPQTRDLAQFVLTEINETTVVVTGCYPNPIFECELGPGRATDASWSKYLFYLNYDHLPDFRIIPDTFFSHENLDQRIDQYRADAIDRVILMGSRGGRDVVASAVEHLQSRDIECETTEFHMAVAAICPLF